jgi:hypothetical protein
MATDPNFALRTHERLFTGRNKHPDPAMRQAAWAAVPKCAKCGQAVFFKGTTPTHYNGSLDFDLGPLEKSQMHTDALATDTHHQADAAIPTQTGAAPIPSRTAGPAVVAKPDRETAAARGAQTRDRNSRAAAKRANTYLGRQFFPQAFDENGITRSASERFQD